MNDTTPPQPISTETAVVSSDVLGIGPTRGQRAAEIVAALRASITQTPEAQALSSFSGRVALRIIHALAGTSRMTNGNVVVLREQHLVHTVTRRLAGLRGARVLLLASGFSSAVLHIARALPHATVIDTDLPHAIAEKQRRLSHAAALTVPPNIVFTPADLSVVNLTDVVGPQGVDMVTLEGVLTYFSEADCVQILRNVLAALKPGGMVWADVPRSELLRVHNDPNFRRFRQHAGSFKLVVDSREAAGALFAKAGYAQPTIVTDEEAAGAVSFSLPLHPIVYFGTAQAPGASPTSPRPGAASQGGG